jgi:hypothetical protein
MQNESSNSIQEADMALQASKQVSYVSRTKPKTHFTKLLNLVDSPHLFCQQGQLNNVEPVLIQVERLAEILLLHLIAYAALLAMVT